MIITVKVRKGAHKSCCDDSAVIGSKIINDDEYQYEGDIPHVIGVADGVGGNAGGKDASMYITQWLSEARMSPDSAILREEMLKLNQELLSYSSQVSGKERMATTLTMIGHSDDCNNLVHVGNTRLFVAQGSFLKQLTVDHTTYQMLMSRGDVAAANCCNKDEIYACFGGGTGSLIQTLEVDRIFKDGFPKMVILTSDGVHEYVDIDRLEELIFSDSGDAEIIENVFTEALNNGSSDDMTMIIARL